MVPWLILDGNFLCHRAFHATGRLSLNGVDTHILHGVMHTVDNLQSLFSTSKIVWCFDHGHSNRSKIYPEYKANRRQKGLDDEAFRAQVEFRLQLTDVRDKWLGHMGYRNVFHQRGFEGDDCVVSVVNDLANKEKEAIIISADKDFFQALNEYVWQYNPTTRKSTTHKTFYKEYGVNPAMWVSIRALSGDRSDNIPGIHGIGDRLACKWYSGELKQDSKAYQKISEGIGIHNRNYELMKLPLAGTKTFILRKDKVTKDKREAVLRELRFER